MQSIASASGKRKQGANSVPREGTKWRAMYDLLMANKGIPVDIPLNEFGKSHGRIVAALRDFYGLDIVRISRGRWVLAGEWKGSQYVDYIADRIGK